MRPSPADAPRSWETGTQNHEGIAGVEAAVEYLASVTCGASATESSLRDRLVYSMNSSAIYEKMLCNQLIQGLISLPDVQLYGITDPDRSAERLCTVACTMKSHRPGGNRLPEKEGPEEPRTHLPRDAARDRHGFAVPSMFACEFRLRRRSATYQEGEM